MGGTGHIFLKHGLKTKHGVQTAEARRMTIPQPVEQNPHSQKDRQDEKAEGYLPVEETR